MMLLSLFACNNENDLSGIRIDALAVVLGDFDDMTTPLTDMEIATQPYDGFIVQATYEPEETRTKRGDVVTTMETLFGVTDSSDLAKYDAVFVNSGTRGLGAFQYNNTLEPDDSLLLDTVSMDHVCEYGESNTLVVSDWAYDLIEYCWPDAIEFFGDDATPDAAQTGAPDEVLADVKDKDLEESLGDAVSVTYNYSAWSVIESVGKDTEVLLSGDIEYQPSSEELYESMEDVPLMVRFAPGRGQVVYSTFHLAAQTPDVTKGLLLGAVKGLDAAVGSDDGSEEPTPAEGAGE